MLQIFWREPYDAAWLAAPDRFAIEPGLPLVAGWQLHKKSPQGSVFHGRVEAAVARWRTEGRALGMTDAELEPFADAFEHAERSAAQRIAG